MVRVRVDAGTKIDDECDSLDKLLIASARGELDKVKEAIEKYNISVNEQDSIGNTALHRACTCDELDVAEYLLSKGAEPNIKNVLGNTALHTAAIFYSKEIVTLLLDNGADKYARNNDDHTAYYACLMQNSRNNDILDNDRSSIPNVIATHNNNEFGKTIKIRGMAYMSMWLMSYAVGFVGMNALVTEAPETTGSSAQAEIVELFQDSAQSLILHNNAIQAVTHQTNIAETVNTLNNIGKSVGESDNSAEVLEKEVAIFNRDAQGLFDRLALDNNASEVDKANIIETLDDGGIDIFDYTSAAEINHEYLDECRIRQDDNGDDVYRDADNVYRCADNSEDLDIGMTVMGGWLAAMLLNRFVVHPFVRSEPFKKMTTPKKSAKKY